LARQRRAAAASALLGVRPSQYLRHFEIPTEGVCHAHLLRCPALRLKQRRRAHQNAQRLRPRSRNIQSVQRIKKSHAPRRVCVRRGSHGINHDGCFLSLEFSILPLAGPFVLPCTRPASASQRCDFNSPSGLCPSRQSMSQVTSMMRMSSNPTALSALFRSTQEVADRSSSAGLFGCPYPRPVPAS